jgi:glycosyltransferase involved in cell wall biosynthesis
MVKSVLFLCDEYPPGPHGGIGTAVQFLARELVKQGLKVYVAGIYTWGYSQENYYNDMGVEVYRYRYALDAKIFKSPFALITKIWVKIAKLSGLLAYDVKRTLPKYYSFLDNLIKEHNIDIIEIPDYQDWMRFCNGVLPLHKFKIPTVVKLHGSQYFFASDTKQEISPNIIQMEHEQLLGASAVVAVSNYVGNRITQLHNYAKPIKVLHNGIEVNLRIPNVPKDKLRVIFAGSLVFKKGIFQLAKAWNKVHELMPHATLWVIGKGKIEPIKALLDKNAINTVLFKGHLDRLDLFSAIAGSQAAIFPSYSETFGLAPVEAMCCGTAVIFTKFSSGPEIIEDNVSGLLVDQTNCDEIADKIVFLLQNPEICKSLAQKGLERANRKFDISIIAKQHIEYYNSLC